MIGGQVEKTILPLFSQDKTSAGIDLDKIADLYTKVQDVGTEVVNAKGGKGSATGVPHLPHQRLRCQIR